MSAALRVRGLDKSFGRTRVLDGVDLDAPAGAVTAVLGRSGSGKTTLLRLVAGFESPDAGTVEVGGRDVVGVPPERRGVGFVPQEGALFPHLSVRANAGYGVRGRRREVAARTDEVLALVGLDGYGDRMPHELSGGQQQRVAVARALAPEPALVLLDEPFSALDPGLRDQVRQQVGQALRATGASAVLVTHDQGEALSWAAHVAVLDDGRMLDAGDPVTLYRRPAHPDVATFLGEANLLSCGWRDGWASTAVGRIGVGDVPDGVGQVLVRPEQVVVATSDAARTPARVLSRHYLGHEAVLRLALPDGSTITARTGDLRVLDADDVGLSLTGRALAYPDA
jgi:iron(III) transport system ATP-binding protein